MVNKKQLIVIGGPTASGKTALAIRLAQHFSTEILSADSRQFYREMNIGTAKPTEEELSLVKHHFINNLSTHDNYSVGDFEKDAIAVLEKLFETKDVVIMVGGTGLYIKAVCEGLDVFPDTPLTIRQDFEALMAENGLEYLQNLLKEVDFEYFSEVDIDNPKRVIRALSVWKASGQPFSSFRKGERVNRFFTPQYICLDVPRPLLYERINTRVDTMIAEGLVAEAKELHLFKHLNSLQTVGYSELFDYFEGNLSLSEAIDKIKQHTRNYAKRQVTWFRKEDYWQHFNPTDFDKIIVSLERHCSGDFSR
jgi:tRNA dimethylallyltransferase